MMVEGLAAALRDEAIRVGAAQTRLGMIRAGSRWDSPAGRAFAARVTELPPVLGAVAERYAGAAAVLRVFAEEFQEAQNACTQAIVLRERGIIRRDRFGEAMAQAELSDSPAEQARLPELRALMAGRSRGPGVRAAVPASPGALSGGRPALCPSPRCPARRRHHRLVAVQHRGRDCDRRSRRRRHGGSARARAGLQARGRCGGQGRGGCRTRRGCRAPGGLRGGLVAAHPRAGGARHSGNQCGCPPQGFHSGPRPRPPTLVRRSS